jgi:mRNA-degrading endonuclease RelE of RelBE toxin-antitoxin system
MPRRPVSVTELAGYTRRAGELLSTAEQEAVVDLVAYDPTRGDLIAGTGGLRKLRIAVGGSGKRGGARVIYYFYSEDFLVLLVALYAKNEKSDLTAREKKSFARLVQEIVSQWRKK